MAQHPYYSGNLNYEDNFQTAPVNIVDRYNFEGRQFPIVFVETSNSEEKRLALNRLITPQKGYSRPCQRMSYLAAKILDTPNVVRADSIYLLEFVTVRPENKELIELRATQMTLTAEASASGVSLPTMSDVEPFAAPVYHQIKYDERYSNIVPGTTILIDSFNSMRPGVQLLVQTFAKETTIGNLYGSRHTINLTLKIHAEKQYETEELTDILTNFWMYELPEAMIWKHGIDVISAGSNGVVEKTGELGEETFTASLTAKFSTEHHYFVPIENIQSYSLQIEANQDLDHPSASSIIWEY
jgi:hypothetical protein